ncbi:leucyl aminopeptidase [Kocuria sediminis]|uniref:Probable cytosol aminopeptidase n=1 Tax=Kocuria sediminis TaxID=1038857 RepID=A0A6N8GPK6_9MICC|nr:leucyl aminopeptidase [Kocuria sediminis]MUN64147.1 leucyl aminopeptidase [Kocuria sediminis]
MPDVQELLEPRGIELTATHKPLGRTPAHALVLAVQKGTDGDGAGRVVLPAGEQRKLSPVLEAAAALRVGGGADEVTLVPAPSGLPFTVVALTGVGDLPESGPERAESLRRAVGAAVRRLAGTDSAVLALPAASEEDAAAVAEGAALGAFAFSHQRSVTAGSVKAPLASAVVHAPDVARTALSRVLDRATALGRGVRAARTLVDLSPNVIYPEAVADYARQAAKGTKVSVTVLAEKDLAKGGYGGLLGVGQGSVHGPRLVKLEYSPARASRHYAYVGKGITFDSGGLSLKPPASMMTMKSDMAGAAAVLATVLTAAELGLPVKVTGWLCLAENLPSSTATRPGDVITIRGGRTVEVLNTDAEGRLVLADGLVAACEEAPDAVVDIATLTGAQMVALGSRTFGIMGDDALRAAVADAARAAGEDGWPMPLPEHLRPSLDSKVADLKNIGDKNGGMLVAGLFLREFVGGPDGARVPWAHVDIAGPSFNEGSPYGYTPAEGTGAGVRTLVRLLEDSAAARG